MDYSNIREQPKKKLWSIGGAIQNKLPEIVNENNDFKC